MSSQSTTSTQVASASFGFLLPANPFIANWLDDIPSMGRQTIPPSAGSSRSMLVTLRQATSFNGSPGRSRDQELAESANKHRDAFNSSKTSLVAAKPQEGWETLQLDQSVNLVCLGNHQIDRTRVFDQCLPRDPTVNRNHPLFSLPTKVRMSIYKYCFAPNLRKITLSPAFATKAAFDPDFFDDPFEVQQYICGALEAFRAIRHELMTYFWTQFHFHVTLSPFTGPKFSPLSHIWLMDYATIVQHLTLEVDFSRFGGGYFVGASDYGYSMEKTDLMLCDIFTRMGNRRGTTVMSELDLLCRRYAGVRPLPPPPAPESILEGEDKTVRLGKVEIVRMAMGGNTKKSEEPKPADSVVPNDKAPYCPELATLICDSLCEMSGLIQKCRLSGFSQDYSEMLMGSLFGGNDFKPDLFKANDLAWPMIPLSGRNAEDSTASIASSPIPAILPTSSPRTSYFPLLKSPDPRVSTSHLSIVQQTRSIDPSHSPKQVLTSDTCPWEAASTSRLIASPIKIRSPGIKTNGLIATAPNSPIALSNSMVASAHLHRTFSSSGLKFSTIPMTTSPLTQDPKTPVNSHPITPKTPCFTRSRPSARSSIKSPTAPTTPNASSFPLSASIVPSRSASPRTPTAHLFGPYSTSSAIHPSSFSLKLTRSRSFKKDFEQHMLKSKYGSEFDGEVPELGKLGIAEQDESDDQKQRMEPGKEDQKGDGSWEHQNIYSDIYDDEGEENYATTPPQLKCSPNLMLQSKQAFNAPQFGDVEPRNVGELTIDSQALDRLTPIRQNRHTFPNSPNTMNQLNEQDPAFLRGLNAIRGLEASRPLESGVGTRPLSFHLSKSDLNQDAGIERCVTSLNTRSNSTRKRYMTFVNRLRGKMEE